jgi:branched-chain amino acid transport system permease protein
VRARAGLLVVAVLAYAVLPLRVSDYWLAVLNLAGIAAIGALGLNLLTGYAGQLSLGHAAFAGVGAYAGGALGASLSLPFPLWLAGAAAVGAVLGLAVAPFAVRLRGHTLVIVTLALVFLAQHAFRNWSSITGGNAGRSDLPSPALPGSHDQGWFWLVWAVVALTALLMANVVRARPGRAMVAMRTSEVAAATMGIDVARTKVAAFMASGAVAGAAGALYGSYKQFVSPEDFGLLLSIQFLAMVLVGGIGTLAGPVLGALFVTGLPHLVDGVVETGAGQGITAAQVSQLLFGVLVVAFVLWEPKGLAQLMTAFRPRRPLRPVTNRLRR